MRRLLLLVAICTFAARASAQFETAKQIYENPKLKETIKSHKLVAILPFKVKISYKRPPKNFDAEANHNQEIQMGTSVQSSMYTYLLRRSDDYTVSFQDVDRTNTLLKKNNLYNDLDAHTKDEIAKALGVDAVIYGNFDQESTKSEAGAIITGALIGFGSKTGEGSLTLQISNGADGDLLWRYSKRMNESLLSSTDDVVERQMRKLSRNFPYTK